MIKTTGINKLRNVLWFAVQCHFAGSWCSRIKWYCRRKWDVIDTYFVGSYTQTHRLYIALLDYEFHYALEKSCFFCKRADTGTRAAEEEAMQQLPRAAGTANILLESWEFSAATNTSPSQPAAAACVVFRVGQFCHRYYIILMGRQFVSMPIQQRSLIDSLNVY